METFINFSDRYIDLFWFIFGFPALIGLGVYFTFRSRAIQLRKFPKILRLFGEYARGEKEDSAVGARPLQMFFAAIGGCIGIGNVVGVCTAVKIGGPGAVFWIWITAILGMLVKYSEVFLGMSYRQANDSGGYDGGPAYYLRKAFTAKWVATLAAVLLCVYGVEVYIFNTLVNTFVVNWDINKTLVIALMLAAVLYGVSGGLGRVGKISTVIVPAMIVTFFFMCLWVIANNLVMIPSILKTVFYSAFHGHAAVGGFAGSSVMLAVSQGVSWGCYTGDIGIGYASVIHSESSEQNPGKQASLAILGIFLDTIVVCTLTLSIILMTGAWNQEIPALLLVQTSLSQYLPYMELFMPILFGMLGYSTIIAFFGVGLKNAEFLGGKIGRKVYMMYGTIMLIAFSYFDPEVAAILMRMTGCLLLIINVVAFFRLRKEISFSYLSKG